MSVDIVASISRMRTGMAGKEEALFTNERSSHSAKPKVRRRKRIFTKLRLPFFAEIKK